MVAMKTTEKIKMAATMKMSTGGTYSITLYYAGFPGGKKNNCFFFKRKTFLRLLFLIFQKLQKFKKRNSLFSNDMTKAFNKLGVWVLPKQNTKYSGTPPLASKLQAQIS